MVLTRGTNETVMIGDDIEITVVRIQQDGRVRLGFTAPRNVPVYRREVWEKRQEGTPPPAEGSK